MNNGFLKTHNFTQGETVDVLTCVVHKKKRTKNRAEFREGTTLPGSVSMEALIGCTSFSTCSGILGLQGSSLEKSEKKCGMNVLHLPLSKNPSDLVSVVNH